MKTKTIFKTLALAMMMPAMLLTTACSSSDDDAIINNENINNENTAKKGFTIPVTVNVTRQGDATTRATYNGTTNQLSFSSGDQLFVWGSNTAGSFAGKLKWQSGGTFSGTITTEKVYTGTADELFSESDNCAVLLPDGYKTYGFLSAGDGYNSDIEYDYTKAFADSKAAAVEQFSCESTTTYDEGFALKPHNAILNFTITGLTASTGVNVVFTKGYLNIDKTVTTNESGTATFAIGVEDYSDLKDCTLTVGGTAITLGSHELVAGHIYNITRSTGGAAVIGHALSASVVGDVVGTDGLAYAVGDKDNLPTGVTAAAVVAYKDGDNGLAIALTDEASAMKWSTAYGNNGAAAHTPTVSGQTWTLPHRDQWKQMLSANGGSEKNCAGLNTIITNAEGTALNKNAYWTSYHYNTWNPVQIECYVYMTLDGNKASFDNIETNDSNLHYVRACLYF